MESEELDDRAWLIERIALELRLVEGMAEDRVADSQKRELEMLQGEGLLLVEGGRVRLTREGKAVSDRIAEMLIPDA